MIPGEYLLGDGDIEANVGRETAQLTVANTGDRPIQVGSHFHFFEANRALRFDRARAFGMSIHYHNRRRVAPKIEEELDATYWASLDQMLARMDIVSVNCPHTPATYHLLSARRLKLMRPEAYIVNTARGEVIDENALARLIADGEIAGAGLDVFEHAPAVNPRLLKLARAGKVVVLPHMGSATIEGRIEMGEKVIVNIRTFLDGHKPPDRVLPSML